MLLLPGDQVVSIATLLYPIPLIQLEAPSLTGDMVALNQQRLGNNHPPPVHAHQGTTSVDTQGSPMITDLYGEIDDPLILIKRNHAMQVKREPYLPELYFQMRFLQKLLPVNIQPGIVGYLSSKFLIGNPATIIFLSCLFDETWQND